MSENINIPPYEINFPELQFLSPDASFASLYVGIVHVPHELVWDADVLTYVGTLEAIKKENPDCQVKTLEDYLKLVSSRERNRICEKVEKESAWQKALDESGKAFSERCAKIKETFPLGSLVKLKCGSPRMVVSSYNKDVLVCIFYMDNRDVQREEFVFETLEKWEDKKA